MTSTASKYNPVLHNGRLNIKSNVKISLIILLMHLFGFPLLIISQMYNLSMGRDSSPDESFVYIAVGATAIAGLAGIIIAMVNFRYLYNKAQVDMCLAAPLSRKQRFLSDYLSGLISYISPFIITTIISGILLLIGHIAYDGKSFPIYNYYGDVSYIYYCECFADVVPIFLTVVYVGILMMIMLYTITVLTACCCGSLFEAVLYNIFINAAIPAVIYVVYYGTFENVLFGINAEPNVLKALSVTSPLGGLVYLAANNLSASALYGYDYAYNFAMQYISAPFWVIGYIIVTALMFALAYYLYNKRKAEHVSKPFVFRGLYIFTISLILIVAIQLAFSSTVDDPSNVISVFIATFAVYMLMEIVSNRGFKRIWMGIIRYAVTVGIFFGFVVLVNKTGCFGAVNNVPSAESIDSIVISTGGIYNEYICNTFRNINYIPDDLNKYGLYEIKSEENIDRVIDIHRNVLERYNNDTRKENFIESEISICYMLKNGRRIVRSYNYGTIGTDAMEAFAALTVSDELRTQASEAYYVSNMNNYDNVSEYYQSRNGTPTFTVSYPWDDENFSRVINDREFYIELNDAFRNDVKNVSAEKYLNPAKSPLCYVWSSYNMRLSGITSDYKETLSFLSEQGLLPPRTDMKKLLSSRYFDDRKIIILSPEDYTELTNGAVYSSCVNISPNYITDQNIETLSSGRFILEYSDDLAEIMENVTNKYISDEPCYTIIIDGSKYKVPEEYSEAAARVYNTGSVSPRRMDDSSDTYYKYYSIY